MVSSITEIALVPKVTFGLVAAPSLIRKCPKMKPRQSTPSFTK